MCKLTDYLLEAVKQNGMIIGLIKDPSEEMQLEAVRQVPFALELIEDPSEKVQLEAVRKDGYLIDYIEDPSEEMQLEAEKSKRNVSNYYDVIVIGDSVKVGCDTRTKEEWLNTTVAEIEDKHGHENAILLESLKEIIRKL